MRAPIAPVLRTLRAPFLLLTPVCVLLGLAAAARTDGHVDPSHAGLALLGALSAHASVNTFNEYFDFRSGLDARTRRTPFSGGSGSLPTHPYAAPWTLAVAVATLLLTAAIGLFFLARQGMALLPLGLAGLFLVVAYTNGLTRHPLACLVAPGLGFAGMALGTHVAITGGYASAPVAAAMVPLFQTSNLLLLNQFPDVEADASVGRRHLPIVLGRKPAARVYALLALAAYVALAAAVALELLPSGVLLGLTTAPLAARAAAIAVREADRPERLGSALRLNVVVCLLTPLLVAVGMLLG